MEVSAIISWKDKEVGKVSNIINDMWYFEGDWLPAGSDHSSNISDFKSTGWFFEKRVSFRNPFLGIGFNNGIGHGG